MAILLIATLGVQFYLNLLKEWDNARLREMQEQALVAGIALGVNSIASDDSLTDFVKREGQPFFDETTTQRINDILVINTKWEIHDSLKPDYFPYEDENGDTKKVLLKDIKNLPPLMEADRLGPDREKFPNALATDTKVSESELGEAHAVPIETNQGRFYVMVILKSDKTESFARAARPLIYNLLVLLVSTLITLLLVARFTRPIADLSEAARKIAVGDLKVRVRESGRTDEIGQLTSQFNEMTAELEKKTELELKLQQAEKSAVVGRLASAIAHEIRNPLNYINLTLDHLRAKFAPEDKKKGEDFEKLTLQLKTEVGRINNQISDFLRYSRPLKLEMAPVDAHKLVEDSLRIVEGQAEEIGIKINLNGGGDGAKILGDGETLRSVFNNLFINAVQAMEKSGGNLDASISQSNGSVAVSVSDTGVGIPQENLEKIFEPYFSTKETGTGLGLAIVKRIVDEHKGTIEVESKENEGTRFTVTLPATN